MKSSKVVNRILGIIISLIFISLFLFFFTILGSPIWLVVISILYAVNLIATTILILQDRHSDAKLSWFFILTFIPIISHVIYFIFGQKYKKRVSRKIYLEKTNLFFKHQNKTDIKNLNLNSNLEKKLIRQNAFVKRDIQDAHTEFFSETSNIYKYVFEDMEKAKKFIHINIYIIKSGEIWEKFRKIITQKRAEGVEIRMIVDDFGNWGMPKEEINYLKKIGVNFHIFGQVFFPFIGSNNGYRTHRKLFLIDGEILHTGGVNLSDEYTSYNKHFGYWMDINLRITGNYVQQYSLLFLYDWFSFTKEKLDHKKYAPLLSSKKNNSKIMLIEDSPENDMPMLEESLIFWINNATKKITISTPYFIPTTRLFDALKTALMSGVEVEIFLPGLPDKKYVYITTLYFAEKLATYGAKIKILNETFLHAKFALFDNDLAYIGTMNIDTRSLYSQYETINLFVDKISVKKIESIIEKYNSISKPLKNKRLNLFKMFFISIFSKLFSSLM